MDFLSFPLLREGRFFSSRLGSGLRIPLHRGGGIRPSSRDSWKFITLDSKRCFREERSRNPEVTTLSRDGEFYEHWEQNEVFESLLRRKFFSFSINKTTKKHQFYRDSLWRLTLPTSRGDGDECGEVTFGSPVCILSSLPSCRLKVGIWRYFLMLLLIPFWMRLRISIRRSVRPSVRNAFFSNCKKLSEKIWNEWEKDHRW